MNVRLSFLLVAILIIFGGTFLIFQFRDSEPVSLNRPWLYRIDEDTIVHIEASHAGRTTNYDRKPGSNTWLIQGETEDVPVYLQGWSGTPLLLSGPQVSRVLADRIDNPAEFGLDPPASVVKVTERSGLTYEFHMGNPTPDGENQYAYLVGDPQLFTVPEIWAQVINRLALEPPYARVYNLGDQDSIIHVGVDHDGQIVDYEYRSLANAWTIYGDTEGLVAEEEWNQILPMLNLPPVVSPLDEVSGDPAAYGLDEPQTRVRVTLRSGQTIDFFLGDATPDGEKRYTQRDEEDEIFTVPESWAQLIIGLSTRPPYAAEAAASGGSG